MRKRTEFEWKRISVLKEDLDKINFHHPSAIMVGNDELKQMEELIGRMMEKLITLRNQ